MGEICYGIQRNRPCAQLPSDPERKGAGADLKTEDETSPQLEIDVERVEGQSNEQDRDVGAAASNESDAILDALWPDPEWREYVWHCRFCH